MVGTRGEVIVNSLRGKRRVKSLMMMIMMKKKKESVKKNRREEKKTMGSSQLWDSDNDNVVVGLAMGIYNLARAFGARLKERQQRMDTYYISHGSPMLPLQSSADAHGFLSRWREVNLPDKPAAILSISAHWYTSEPLVNSVTKNDTIHDFYGFPPELYTLQYNAPGSPALAQRVKELLKSAGFKSVREDPKRGLDHGAWVPLYLMYPEADIPVVQLSVQPHKDGAHHFKMGQALAPLRDEGVLIMGSGSATHNLRALDLSNGPPPAWALSFDNWLNDSLINGRFEDVINYEKKAPNAKQVHPSTEHFYPLLVAMGAAGVNAKAERIHTSWMASSLSMASFSFKSNP